MPPRRSTKTKSALSQPTLSFSAQRPLSTKTKGKGQNAKPALARESVSTTSIELENETVEPEETASEEKKERRKLDPSSKQWNSAMKHVRTAMGNMDPIHAGKETHNNVHHILRIFDMTSSYGPCVGMTRLQRWERAKKWGLNPPEEIHTILTTAQGEDETSYRETVFHGWV
ncbi:DNA polymerase delta subunit 4, partial [Tremellales sp. Uapishka_1]